MPEGAAGAGLGILVPGGLRKAQVAEAERGSQEAHLVDTHTSCSGEKGKPTCDATLSRSVLQLPEE